MKKEKKILIIFLLILTSLIISLLILEIIIRKLPSNITKIDFSLTTDNRIFTNTRIYKYKPNSARSWVGLGPPTVWYFNNFGFRDRDFEMNNIDSKLKKIVFIGDSIIMGLGVEDYQSIPRQLEEKLQPKEFIGGNTQFYQVYNLGLWASGPKQYEAVMREVGVKLHPDIVIVAHFPNDPSDDAYMLNDQKYIFLKSIPDAIVPYNLNEFLKQHSYLYLLVLNRYYTFVERYKNKADLTAADFLTGWTSNGVAINNIKKMANDIGAKFLLVGIPDVDEVRADQPDDRIKKIKTYITDKYNIPYIDLENDLRNYPNIDELYIDKSDTHFSIKGNEVVAGWIQKYLIRTNLVNF